MYFMRPGPVPDAAEEQTQARQFKLAQAGFPAMTVQMDMTISITANGTIAP